MGVSLEKMASLLLAGRAALVTGSTSGIGAAIARSLGRAGANLVLNGLVSSAEAASTRARFEAELGVKVVVSTHDLATAAGVREMAAMGVSAFGALDVIVNNAGVQHISPVEEFPPEKWDTILAINLSSSFHLIRHTLPSMRARGFGRIINIASVHGLVASTNKSAYVAAKHGLIGLTKAVALETAGSGVTCNAICPGWVLTPLIEKQIELRAQQRGVDIPAARIDLLSEKQPSKQFVEPSALGDLALFLCSPAAAQMTGVSLPVDGGWTAC